MLESERLRNSRRLHRSWEFTLGNSAYSLANNKLKFFFVALFLVGGGGQWWWRRGRSVFVVDWSTGRESRKQRAGWAIHSKQMRGIGWLICWQCFSITSVTCCSWSPFYGKVGSILKLRKSDKCKTLGQSYENLSRKHVEASLGIKSVAMGSVQGWGLPFRSCWSLNRAPKFERIGHAVSLLLKNKSSLGLLFLATVNYFY